MLVSLAAASAHAQQLTKKNWRNDPRILEVRALYESTNKLQSENRLTVARKNGDACSSADSERIKYTDEHGVVRRYVMSDGGEDSTLTIEHTYDEQGKLRFALVQAGAVSDSALELRFYFDASGKLLWRARSESGPGWTWDDDELLHMLARSPKAEFKGFRECK